MSNGCMDIENRLMHTEGRKERARQAEEDGDICTTMCKIDSQWKFAV